MSDELPRSYVHLRQRYSAIVAYTGMIFMICAGLMLVPITCVIFWPAELRLAIGFVLPAVGLGLLGMLLWRRFRPHGPTPLTTAQGGVIVVLSWGIACLVSAIPFMLVEGMDFTHGLFEATSGWTTTGLTVLDFTEPTRMILLWRSLMQFVGGAGIAIIMMASVIGPAGIGLSAAEGREEQLVPHVRASVRLIATLYSGYLLVGILGYWIAGMPAFDAINHSMTTVSTGGFSTRAASIGAWDNLRIETVAIPLMLLGAVNFLTIWELVQRRYHRATRSGELRLVAVLVPLGAMLLYSLVTGPLYGEDRAGRVAVFEAVSGLTQTGLTTTNYAPWSAFGLLVILTLMSIGGGAGSTSAGIKQYRIYLLLMSLRWRIQQAFLPPTAVVERFIWRGEQKDFVDHRRIRESGDYFFLFVSAVIIVTLIIAATGISLREALFDGASIVGTVGLSVGVISATAHPAILWAGIIGMFLGRLEFYVVITGLLNLLSDSRKLLFVRRRPPSDAAGGDTDATRE